MRSCRAYRTKRRFDRRRPLASPPIEPPPRPRRRPAVLVTRPEAATPALRQALRARGTRLLLQPMLRIEALREPLPETGDAQAVIATSAHAFAGIDADRFPLPLPVFVVGRATATAARRAGFEDVRQARDAQTLAADVRAACSPRYGPLLYPAGRHRARDLSRMLTEFEVRLAERYSAEPARRLAPTVRKAIANGEVQAVTLYSGRAARAFVAACRQGGVWPQARRIPAFCLSRRIAAVLKAQGWGQAWGAPLPQAERLTTRLLGRRFSHAAMAAPSPAAPVAAHDPQPIRDEAMTSSPPAITDAETERPSRARSVQPHWVAIVAVAALAAIAVIWLWSELQNSNARRDAIAANMAALSTRIDDLAKIPTFADPVTVDKLVVDVADLGKRTSENAKGVTAIGERVDVGLSTVDARLNSQADQISGLKAATAEKTDALTSQANQLSADLKDLRAQADATKAALADVTAKQASDAENAAAQLSALNAQVKDLDQRLGTIERWIQQAQPARIAEQLVALAELRRMVETGAPFAAPLKRVQGVLPAATGTDTQSGWAAYAGQGIPTVNELSQRLGEIARNRPRSGPVDSGSRWVDSAVGTLLKGVRIGEGPPLGSDPVADAIYTARKALAAGDLEAADAAVAPVAEQDAAMVEWRKALQARRDALATIAAWDQSVLAGISEAPK